VIFLPLIFIFIAIIVFWFLKNFKFILIFNFNFFIFFNFLNIFSNKKYFKNLLRSLPTFNYTRMMGSKQNKSETYWSIYKLPRHFDWVVTFTVREWTLFPLSGINGNCHEQWHVDRTTSHIDLARKNNLNILSKKRYSHSYWHFEWFLEPSSWTRSRA